MTLLTEKRIRALKRANGNPDRINTILLEGALIQWRALEAYERKRARDRANYEKRKQKRKAEEARNRLRRIAEEQAQARRSERELQRRKHRELIINIIQLVKEKKVSPTHRLMKTIKDPNLKQQLVEATCLSRV